MHPPKFHPFKTDVTAIEFPARFTNPFHYTPHPLCLIAVEEVQREIKRMVEQLLEPQEGKMFGVLVVRNALGKLGYIVAFSGNLGGSNELPFFVPPVLNFLQSDGYFRKEEVEISAINGAIDAMEQDDAFLKAQSEYKEQLAQFLSELQSAKELQRQQKLRRDSERSMPIAEQQRAELVKESQFEKANIKRLERRWKEQLALAEAQLLHFQEKIDLLKTERKERSAALQQWLFEQFELLNARGERQNLLELFLPTTQGIPPAGAGECAAPKLLHYAYANNLQPISMAEFWWGASPTTAVRQAGHFYPACKGKCEPILKHMLHGLDVENNVLESPATHHLQLPIVYEDESLLVVNKPSGLLSVPGKLSADSVWHRISRLHPEYDGPLVVHRLDMATSGLLLIAKTKSVYQHLQRQFKNRTVKKRYIALLEGVLTDVKGLIDLPLCLDPLDRPRQMVNYEHGKRAITRWQLLEKRDKQTLVAFYPETGRTHQLRVHAAHHLGLNAPIVGDELYGKKAERLYLHAEQLEFIHPNTLQPIHLQAKAEFF